MAVSAISHPGLPGNNTVVNGFSASRLIVLKCFDVEYTKSNSQESQANKSGSVS